MIREATHEDLPQIVVWGGEFHAASPYAAMGYDPDAFRAFCETLIANDTAALFVADDGMIGGVLTSPYFNPALTTAAELFWWAKGSGRALREAFETWAKDHGAFGAQFSGLADHNEPAIRRNFDKAGYQPTEIAFLKRF